MDNTLQDFVTVDGTDLRPMPGTLARFYSGLNGEVSLSDTVRCCDIVNLSESHHAFGNDVFYYMTTVVKRMQL